MREKKNSERIGGRIILVGFLWLLQSIGRVFFAILGTPTGMGQFLNTPIPNLISLILFIMFLSLGVFGLITAFGLLTRRKWGFWSTRGLTLQSLSAFNWVLLGREYSMKVLLYVLNYLLYCREEKS